MSEKLEFLYLSPYYLQAACFLLGTTAWILAETLFRTRLPFWTNVWGWSLVLTNLLSLPLMNTVGLFLEEAEERDYLGILSFTALTYLLAPFQAYAAVKGFLESEEGPWFRTPKTGRITDVFTRGKFYRFVAGIFPRASPSTLAGFSLNPYLALETANNRFSAFAIRRRKVRWVGRLILGFLLMFSISVYSASRGVTEVFATNPTGPFYLRDEASSVLTGTTAEWRLADNQADTTDSTTTIARVNNKKTGPLWFQYQPGVANSTEESGTSCAANTPDNAGWIFETAFDGGGQIDSGTWTFYVNETDNRAVNVGTIQVCVWRVAVSGGTISTSNLLFGYNDSTDVWDGAVNNFSFITGTVGPFSLGPDEYLYLEYFSNLTTINSAGASTDYDSIFRTGPTYSDPRIVIPSVTIPETVVFFVTAAPFIPYVVHLWMKKKNALVYDY